MKTAALSVVAAAPAVVTTCALLAFAAREVSGTTPLSLGPPQNIAEAARMGQAADVLRFLRAGQDPARVWTLRPAVSPRLGRATALEAAVWSGRGPLVAMLDRQGAIGDVETRRFLFCLARDLPAPEVASALFKDQSPACEPGRALEQVRKGR